jgi:ABC-type branched-subunit amino acid transport system substrate-binding protein
MRLLNTLTLSALASLIASSTSQAAVVPAAGYGSSDAVLPAKNQELFLMGFELGVQTALPKRTLSDLIVLDQVADGSQLGAMGAAKRLIDKGVAMLAGFPTSHEAVLAGRIAQEKGILAIFSGAGHSDLAKMGDTVFTTGESMQYSVEVSLDFILNHFKGQKGALVSNPFAVFSKNQEEIFLELLKDKRFSHLSLPAVRMRKDQLLGSDDIAAFKRGEYAFICLTPYADESARLLEQLKSNGIDLPILANTSWTTGDVDFGRRFLTARKAPTYSATSWVVGSKESLPFEKAVRNRYGREATGEIAYGYELGIVVGKTLARLKGPATRASVLAAFREDPCFDGTPSGRMCFPKAGGHAQRSIKFVKFQKTGFVPVK